MKTITIRGIHPELAEKLTKTASQSSKSINKLLLDTLEERFGMKKKKRFTNTYDDMDHLFGRWTEQEFQQIQEKIDTGRQIDEELWK